MAVKTNSTVILSAITDEIFNPKRLDRMKMSARRIINEYQVNRVWKEGKDWENRKFPSPSREYAIQKDKILSGKMKGRGGKGKSKTIARFKKIVSSLNTSSYTAKTSSDRARFTGRLLTTFDVPLDSISIVRQRNGRYKLDFSVGVDAKGSTKTEVENQLRGLRKKRYYPLGFKSVPGDLRLKLENAFIRILNK